MEQKDVQQPLKTFAEVSLQAREMVYFKSESGAQEIVFGRHPAARYGEEEKPPVEIGPGILPVKLEGTTRNDTSRQQFGIERQEDGPFILKNYSNDILRLEGIGGGSHNLQKGMATRISVDPLGMQRVKISWRGGCEVSVQSAGAGSDDRKWSIGFMWKKP